MSLRIIPETFTYVNREVEEIGHPLHCDSGVIFGHYSDVLGTAENTVNMHICTFLKLE